MNATKLYLYFGCFAGDAVVFIFKNCFWGVLFCSEKLNYFDLRLELSLELCGFILIFIINRKLNFAKMSVNTLLQSHDAFTLGS